uniref:Uncharacterized protein n=1 Tax=Arundo donax TaxID=35708 RepID=A0A0A9D717_ARUDO
MPGATRSWSRPLRSSIPTSLSPSCASPASRPSHGPSSRCSSSRHLQRAKAKSSATKTTSRANRTNPPRSPAPPSQANLSLRRSPSRAPARPQSRLKRAKTPPLLIPVGTPVF